MPLDDTGTGGALIPRATVEGIVGHRNKALALYAEAFGAIEAADTIPKVDHAQLLKLAQSKHVSFGWMVREAIRVYLDQQTPLLSGRHGASP